MCATRRGLRSGIGQMDMKKLDHARVAEVALDDSHNSRLLPTILLRLPTSTEPTGGRVVGQSEIQGA